jgi:hypothetical protein
MSRLSFVLSALALSLLACIGDDPERAAEEPRAFEWTDDSALTIIAPLDDQTSAPG